MLRALREVTDELRTGDYDEEAARRHQIAKRYYGCTSRHGNRTRAACLEGRRLIGYRGSDSPREDSGRPGEIRTHDSWIKSLRSFDSADNARLVQLGLGGYPTAPRAVATGLGWRTRHPCL